MHDERAHICTMPGAKVTCTCGAIYAVIKTKGPLGCGSLLNAACATGNYSHGRNVGQFRLIWRPDEDRE